MNRPRRYVVASACLLACLCAAGDGSASAAEGETMARKAAVPDVPWNLAALSKPPQVYPAPLFSEKGVRALFYDGLPWKGKPTRVFAWYGAPDRKEGEKVPAMILVHGGGGTAFADWVRLWTQRGYAAISMDTCGCTAGGEHMKRPRHEFGGPPGWGGFDQIDQPVEDQWMCHAVADCILANSLLRSFPEVDADRIGMTGISWGGIVACIVAGVDTRLKFAAPAYGCGHLDEISGWIQGHGADASAAKRWAARWDPSHYLSAARMPMLWIVGTNDFAFPLPQFQASYRQAPGPRTLCVRVAMVHGQEQGAAPEEIAAFADHLLKGGPPLARIAGQGADGRSAWVTFAAGRPVAKAELVYTLDKGAWKDRKWRSAPAKLDAAAGRATADLPEGAAVHYFNLTDERGLIVSGEHTTP